MMFGVNGILYDIYGTQIFNEVGLYNRIIIKWLYTGEEEKEKKNQSTLEWDVLRL